MGNIGSFSIQTDIVKIDCSCKVEHHKVPSYD
jgi:hypothetical protein